MCLILVSWRHNDDYPLVVAANRDEYHARPAATAAFWEDRPAILAGRDLQAMGTWMGVSQSGKFCAVTNFRGAREPSAAASRGTLVTHFLESGGSPAAYLQEVAGGANRFSGFNLLAADADELWWMSNRQTSDRGQPRRLAPGVYALGNDLLDSDDVAAARAAFKESPPAVEALFAVLGNFRITGPQYGTRCSTVLLRAKDGQVHYAERSFAADGTEGETARFEFRATG